MKFMLANPSHDAQLRSIIRSEAMPGHIQLSYEREPAFFHGLETQGTFNQVMTAEDDGRIVGFGCRSIRPMFINGNETDFGYLSGLRSSPLLKRKLGLARGYSFLRELHEDGRCPGYITTIIDGNTEALATIAAGRARLPHYLDMGVCYTYAVALNRRKRVRKHAGIAVRFACGGEEGSVVDILRHLGRQYQFFPALHASDFGTPLLRDLPVTRFLIAETDGIPCGIASIWDQSAFKQHRIHSCSHALQLSRPLINLGMKAAGFRPLPGAGQLLSHAYLSFAAVLDNDPRIMQALIEYAHVYCAEAGCSHMIVGFHENNPARGALDGMPKTAYRSRLFFVGWEKELETFNTLDGRVPNFDPAIL